jgi:hypothetical protein
MMGEWGNGVMVVAREHHGGVETSMLASLD